MRCITSALAAAAVAAIAGFAPVAMAQTGQSASVMVIDYERILGTSTVGASLNQQFNDIGRRAQAPLLAEQTALEQEETRIVQSTQGMTQEQVESNSSLVQQITQFQQRSATFQACQRVIGRDISYTREVTLVQFNSQLTPFVRQVMEARGAGVVIDANSAQLVLPAYDATQDVINAVNQGMSPITVSRLNAPDVPAVEDGDQALQQQQQMAQQIINDCRARFPSQ